MVSNVVVLVLVSRIRCCSQSNQFLRLALYFQVQTCVRPCNLSVPVILCASTLWARTGASARTVTMTSALFYICLQLHIQSAKVQSSTPDVFLNTFLFI